LRTLLRCGISTHCGDIFGDFCPAIDTVGVTEAATDGGAVPATTESSCWRGAGTGTSRFDDDTRATWAVAPSCKSCCRHLFGFTSPGAPMARIPGPRHVQTTGALWGCHSPPARPARALPARICEISTTRTRTYEDFDPRGRGPRTVTPALATRLFSRIPFRCGGRPRSLPLHAPRHEER
jgi:hypothetical protein